MLKHIEITVESATPTTAFGVNGLDTVAYKLELSAESNGRKHTKTAYWGDNTGLEANPYPSYAPLVDGKQRVMLSTRVDFINSVVKKAFNNWHTGVTKVEFDIDAEIGKEAGVCIDEYLADNYVVDATLHADIDENSSVVKSIVNNLNKHIAKLKDDEEAVFFIYSDQDAANEKLSICVLDDEQNKQTTIELLVDTVKDPIFTHIQDGSVIQVIETDINNEKTVVDSSGLTLAHLQDSMKALFLIYNSKLHTMAERKKAFSIHQGCPW